MPFVPRPHHPYLHHVKHVSKRSVMTVCSRLHAVFGRPLLHVVVIDPAGW